MKFYEIPLTPEPQRFTIELAGTPRVLRLYWNRASEAWCLDLSTPDGTLLLGGIPVVTGCDLLAQYAYMNLGGSLIAQTDHDPDAVPDFNNLGLTGRLYFVTT